MPEFATKKRNTAPARPPSLTMHAGQCSICRYVRREEIERAFLDWTGPQKIACEYGLGSHTTVYRHAHAVGLFARRERALQFALRLGQLIDRAGDWESTETDIRSAMRLVATMRARGALVDEGDGARTQCLPASSAEGESQKGTRASSPRKRRQRERLC